MLASVKYEMRPHQLFLGRVSLRQARVIGRRYLNQRFKIEKGFGRGSFVVQELVSESMQTLDAQHLAWITLDAF